MNGREMASRTGYARWDELPNEEALRQSGTKDSRKFVTD